MKDICIDPWDRDLINGLLNRDWKMTGISWDQFKDVIDFYDDLSQKAQITDYTDIVSIINYRRQRNTDEHESLNNNVEHCTKTSNKPNFLTLLNELNLMPLTTYKKQDMPTLETIFFFTMKVSDIININQ